MDWILYDNGLRHERLKLKGNKNPLELAKPVLEIGTFRSKYAQIKCGTKETQHEDFVFIYQIYGIFNVK